MHFKFIWRQKNQFHCIRKCSSILVANFVFDQVILFSAKCGLKLAKFAVQNDFRVWPRALLNVNCSSGGLTFSNRSERLFCCVGVQCVWMWMRISRHVRRKDTLLLVYKCCMQCALRSHNIILRGKPCYGK
jgi:hypothetical protein